MKPEEALAELEDSIKGEGYQCHKEVYEMAIEALEKQIEMPWMFDNHISTCPRCRFETYVIANEEMKYCPKCGQKVGGVEKCQF